MLDSLIATFKAFGPTEWSMFVSTIICVVVLFIQNAGLLKCKDKLEAYELELKDKSKLIEYYENITGKGFVVNESTNQD